MTGRSAAELAILVAGFAAAAAVGLWTWQAGGPRGEKFDFDPRSRRAYSPDGALQSIAADSDGDLVFDMWSYMQGGKLIRIDFDDDQDGRIDRRRFFRADGTIDRTESLASSGSGK